MTTLLLATEPKPTARSRPTPREEDAWTGRFSARLATLKPLLSMLARHQKALAAFEVARDLEPEAAARICAQAPPPALRFLAGRWPAGTRKPAAIDAGIWLLRFVVKLRQLAPQTSLDEAERAALETLDMAGAVIDADEAAAIYSADVPPTHAGAPSAERTP